MKAIVYERYGAPDVLELRDIEVPSVADDGVLVRIRAAPRIPTIGASCGGKPLFARLMFGFLDRRRQASAPIWPARSRRSART